jgi:flavin-dependent dehydrogenase
MKIAIAGGGPGGLYSAILLRQVEGDHEVTVFERNAPDDTFGFGVVFSDAFSHPDRGLQTARSPLRCDLRRSRSAARRTAREQ